MLELRRSLISEYLSGCGWRVGLRLDGVYVPAHSRMIVGTATHKGAEKNNRQKVATKKDLKLKDVQEISIEAFKEEIKENGWTPEPEQKSRKELALNEEEKRVLKFSEVLSKDVLPKHQPVEVEKSYKLQFRNVIVTCIIDNITDKEIIQDLKTTGKKPDFNRYWFQMVFYSLIVRKYKDIISKAEIDAITSYKVKPYLHSSNLYDITESDQDLCVTLTNKAIDGILAGVFIPRTDYWGCSPKYCGFHGTKHCKFGR